MAVVVLTTAPLDFCVSCGSELAAAPGAPICVVCRAEAVDERFTWPGRERCSTLSDTLLDLHRRLLVVHVDGRSAEMR